MNEYSINDLRVKGPQIISFILADNYKDAVEEYLTYLSYPETANEWWEGMIEECNEKDALISVQLIDLSNGKFEPKETKFFNGFSVVDQDSLE